MDSVGCVAHVDFDQQYISFICTSLQRLFNENINTLANGMNRDLVFQTKDQTFHPSHIFSYQRNAHSFDNF